MCVMTSLISSFVRPLASARSMCPFSWSPRYIAVSAATVMTLRSRLESPGRSQTSAYSTFSLRSISLGTTPRTSSLAGDAAAGVAMSCLLVGVCTTVRSLLHPRCSGELHQAGCREGPRCEAASAAAPEAYSLYVEGCRKLAPNCNYVWVADG